MAQRPDWTPLDDPERGGRQRSNDPAAPGGPADVVAGAHRGHWDVPRDYGALADAAGRRGARDEYPSGRPPAEDPLAPGRYRYDMKAPAGELHDREQFLGGHPFSGLAGTAEPPRGPKGYRRSDDRIREDICEALISATHLDASEVSVDVNEAVVTMQGIVPERRMKHAIEDIAASVRGVIEVENRIRVVRGGADPLLERDR